MKSFVLLLLLVSTLASGLEVRSRSLTWHPPKSEEILMNSDWWGNGSIKMPFVTAGSAEISSLINDALYIVQMDIPAPVKPGKSFSLPKGMSPDGVIALDFKVNRNDAAVLEIEFSAEGCGAYCENYTTVADFDVRSGRAISLDDLLTPGGKVTVANKMLKHRNKLYLAQIHELKKLRIKQLAVAKKTGKKDDLEDTDERIALNESCLKPDLISDAEADESMRYGKQFKLPARGGIVLIAERCSPHVTRALDDVGEVSLTLTLKDLRPALTTYGKALLQGQRRLPPPPSMFNKVFHGKLGGSAVTVMFKESYGSYGPEASFDDSFSAAYYYNKYHKLIPLTGVRTGKQITLTEDINDQEKATFKLERDKTGLSGTWLGGSKELPVVLGY